MSIRSNLKTTEIHHTSPREVLADHVDGFTGIRLAVVGDMIADEYVYGLTWRISREAPVLILRHAGDSIVMGGALNSVNNIIALGGTVFPLGYLGMDSRGDRLMEYMESRGVDTSGILRISGVDTITKTRVMAGSSNTTMQQVVRIDREPEDHLPAGTDTAILEKLMAIEDRIDGVLVSDYGYGAVGPAMREYLSILCDRGKIVTVDSRYGLMGYRNVSFMTPNEEEVEGATSQKIADETHLYEVARSIRKTTSCKSLLVTRGSRGMALMHGDDEMDLLPIYGSDEIADVTGAGDTVASTLTLSVCSGLGVHDSCRVANFAASVVVLKNGTATLDQEELKNKILREPLCGIARRMISREYE
ncbi:MAG: hypothetical protein CVV64_01655 [Candidatus Wallbacteria bacterium HGW-Wallbacteria-1]|jgi:rfaE bifunctional protein kinase chain/domain|uniref:Carbohydrate kinase PfkB domain-containing protein n=1 Tax=Candidatus Wallbacteria bacterium HGW-Wallbacteria-1 TaxID=2013854 RepID=A0A2N1PUY3_9BACT|nr:MAG: hypothetical protein CVV64_01655 [Candidatus Wallbacteria bacterium HGW-Wallbacteria-1]